MRKTLRNRYRDLMATYGCGYVLLFELLHPGTLSCFDDDRHWHQVVYITYQPRCLRYVCAMSALGCMPFTPSYLRAPDIAHTGTRSRAVRSRSRGSPETTASNVEDIGYI